jgi:hypothetical protein
MNIIQRIKSFFINDIWIIKESIKQRSDMNRELKLYAKEEKKRLEQAYIFIMEGFRQYIKSGNEAHYKVYKKDLNNKFGDINIAMLEELIMKRHGDYIRCYLHLSDDRDFDRQEIRILQPPETVLSIWIDQF